MQSTKNTQSTIRTVSCYGSLEELVEHKDDIILYFGCETMTDVAYYLIDEVQAEMKAMLLKQSASK